jgi:hypothetical protein
VIAACSSVGQADSPIRASSVAFAAGPGRNTAVSPGPRSCSTVGCGWGMSRALETSTMSVPAGGGSDRTCTVARCSAGAPPRLAQVLEASNRSSSVTSAMFNSCPVVWVRHSRPVCTAAMGRCNARIAAPICSACWRPVGVNSLCAAQLWLATCSGVTVAGRLSRSV